MTTTADAAAAIKEALTKGPRIAKLEAALATARADALEEAAHLIDGNVPFSSPNGGGLKPRGEDDQFALVYATAIRALKGVGREVDESAVQPLAETARAAARTMVEFLKGLRP